MIPGAVAAETVPVWLVSTQNDSDAVPPSVSARLVATARCWLTPSNCSAVNCRPETQFELPMFWSVAFALLTQSIATVFVHTAPNALSCQSGPSSKFQ